MTDLFIEIFQTMRTNKLRTVLTGIAVSWGIMMLMVLVGIAQGVIDGFTSSDFAQSPNVVHMWGGFASKPWNGLKAGRSVSLKESNTETISKELSDRVEDVSGEVSGDAVLSTLHGSIPSGNFTGVMPSTAKQMSISMNQGRFINDNDIQQSRKVIVLEKQNVVRLFGDTIGVVGQYVNVKNIAFLLVGYYEHPWRSETYIPYTTAKSINGYSDKISPINVTMKNVDDLEESDKFESDLRSLMAKINHHAPDDTSALWIWNQFSSYLSALGAMSILSVTMWIIGILTLMTGLVGVSNIMFVSVRERTHEIGVRRAIGARPRSILSQIILESITITAMFGYIGILMGTLVVNVVGHYLGDSEFITPPKVNFALAVQVTLLMIIAGAVAGIFPARRALKINAVEALRSE